MALTRLLLACALVTGVAGCGSGGDRQAQRTATPRATTTATPAPADPVPDEPVTAAESRAIRGWSDSLRRGHVDRAARYFALPSLVANGTPLLRVRTRAQAAAFNRALPCGAKVVALDRGEHHSVVATFRLTERSGAGRCGSGTGALARTAFRIRDRRIALWLRVPSPGQGSEPTTPS
jgi:hypothetical protein